MFIKLERSWHVLDGSTQGGTGLILAGEHEIERVPAPSGQGGHWLVLKGTLIGAAEVYWRDQRNAIITDDPDRLKPKTSVDKVKAEVITEV